GGCEGGGGGGVGEGRAVGGGGSFEGRRAWLARRVEFRGEPAISEQAFCDARRTGAGPASSGVRCRLQPYSARNSPARACREGNEADFGGLSRRQASDGRRTILPRPNRRGRPAGQ